MINFSKTTLLSILLIIFFLAAGFFAYQWWQIKGELARQIEENENLKNQIAELQVVIDKLQKEIEELKATQGIKDEMIVDKKEEVSITTDKTEYRQGEIVKITVRNNLDKSIWYTDFGVYPWWKLEVRENKEWKSIKLLLPTLTKYGEECIAFPPPQSIEEVLKELKTNRGVTTAWNLRYCKDSTPSFIESGNYRLAFTYGLTTDSYAEKTVYSNEFIIK